MFHKFILSICLLALATVAPAAAAKKAAKAPEAESALSKALAQAVGKALDGLQAMQASAKQKKRPAALLRQAEELKQDLKEQLERLRGAHVDDSEAASKDAAVVAVAAGLRAADLIASGLKDDDDDQLQAGYQLGEMAIGDLESLDEGGEEAALGGGDSGGGGYEIGPSLGGDFALGSQTNAFNMSTNLSMSLPISQAMDLGAGFSLGLNSSDDGRNSSVATNLGFNAFTRYHFLQAFAQSPWIVPYVGAKLGWQGNDSSSLSSGGGSYSASSSSSSGTSVGLQLGTLFFVNKKTAITAQVESSTSNSSSGAAGSPSSSSSLALSMGVRMMF
jgi:hypothetical protein